MPVDTEALDSSIAKIKARYEGKGGGTGKSVQMGDEEPAVDRIPTGSLELDFIFGGGLPIGRWSRFWGPWSSGKSLISLNCIREAQKMGMTCAYYNIEKQYTKEFARANGIDTEKLVVVQGTVIEDVGVKMEELLSSVHLHVLDSCSSATSIDELSAGMEEWRPAIQARAWGKVFRHVSERFDENDNAIIYIDQARDVFGSHSQEPPGGRFMEHMSSLTVHFKRSSWLFKDANGILDYEGAGEENISGDVEPQGIEFQALVQKSRVCRPNRKARMRYAYEDRDREGKRIGGGIDRLYELEKLARWLGIIEKTSEKSSYYRRADKEKFADGSETKQGQAKLRAAIAEDKKLQRKIEDRVKKVSKW